MAQAILSQIVSRYQLRTNCLGSAGVSCCTSAHPTNLVYSSVSVVGPELRQPLASTWAVSGSNKPFYPAPLLLLHSQNLETMSASAADDGNMSIGPPPGLAQGGIPVNISEQLLNHFVENEMVQHFEN